MSLFDLIRYPVNASTWNFNHLPDDMWEAYLNLRQTMSFKELEEENKTNALIIKLIKEWEE